MDHLLFNLEDGLCRPALVIYDGHVDNGGVLK